MADYLPVSTKETAMAPFDSPNERPLGSRVQQMKSKTFFALLLLCAVGVYVVGGTVGYACGKKAALAPASDSEGFASGVQAVMTLRPNDANVTGTIFFTQNAPDAPVTVSGTVFGLTPNSKRGFHVHQYGDLTDGCTSAGSHFNPYHTKHGAPDNKLSERHIGDLGNIQSDNQGVAKVDYTDVTGGISLHGVRSILGRAIVVHTGTDDLGKGGNEESKKTGNAGSRAACGIIGYAQPEN
jgi:Cu-Zn family superoxide dismutase